MKSQKRKRAEIRRALNYLLPGLVTVGMGCGIWNTLNPVYQWPKPSPPPDVPDSNAVAVFEKAAAIFANVPSNANLKFAINNSDLKKPAMPSLPLLRAALKTNQPALSLFRKALSMECQYPVARSWKSPVPLRLNEVELAKFVVLEGKAHEADKDWRAASDSYLDVYEYGIKMGSRSHLINQLIGTVIQSCGAKPLALLLDRCDEATTTHVIRRMTPLYARRSPAFMAIQEEWDGTIVRMKEETPNLKIWQNNFERIKFNRELPKIAKHWHATIDWAKTPPYLRGALPVYPPYDDDPIKKFFLASNGAPPRYQTAIWDTDKRQTQSQMTLVKAYLTAYRCKNVVFPVSLEVLRLPAGIEIDPYTNAPFHYVPPPDKTTAPKLYSFGINKRDDNGSADDLKPDSEYCNNE